MTEATSSFASPGDVERGLAVLDGEQLGAQGLVDAQNSLRFFRYEQDAAGNPRLAPAAAFGS